MTEQIEPEIQTTTDPTELTPEALEAALEGAEKQVIEPAVEGTPEPEITPPTVEELTDQLTKLEKTEQEQRVMIKRQSNELGTLRKKVYTPPTKEEKAALMERAAEGDESAMDEYANRRADMDYANQVTVLEAVPNFEELKQDIANLAIGEGYDQTAINYFLSNPWRTDAHTTIALARKVAEGKELVNLRTENKTLKQTGPTDVVGMIEKAQKAAPSITPSTPSTQHSANETEIGVDQVSKLSDKDLDALLNKI